MPHRPAQQHCVPSFGSCRSVAVVTASFEFNGSLGSEVVVAVAEEDAAVRPGATGPGLAERLGVPLRSLHVDPTADADLAASIAGALRGDSILVIHSEHANRWSGKWSVAEHVIDEWGGLTVATGVRHVPVWRRGPVLVGVDGSESAVRSISVASVIARVFGVGVVVCQVVSADERDRVDAIAEELRRHLDTLALDGASVATPIGNDPISALVKEADDRSSVAVVLSSRGDRASRRSTISRTCSGVIAGAVQPVVVVGAEIVGPADGRGSD